MTAALHTFRQSHNLRNHVCARCRALSVSATLASGHNRWSKIKHDKGRADIVKARQRAFFSQELKHASKLQGPEPNSNPRLALAIANAKQAGLPKASIDTAIMRGQGLNISGNPLQPLLMEAIFSPGVAVLIDCETESKARTLQEVRIIIKKYGGTGTPTSHMFKKRGRIIFESDERGLTMDDLLDDAVESGAEDVDSDEDGHIVIYTEPSKTISTAAALAQKRALKIRSSDIMWEARSETAVVMDSEASLKTLVGFMDDVLEEPSVQGVYMNVTKGAVDPEIWAQLKERIEV